MVKDQHDTHAEQTLAALEGSPFNDEQKLMVMTVADSFVDGHALHRIEVTMEQAPDAAVRTRSLGVLEKIASGPYPRMHRSWVALESWRPLAAAWMDESFERGVRAMLEGFIRLLSDQS